MKKVFLILICLLLIPIKVHSLELDSYIVMDMNSKRILKEQNKDKKIYPASTTKIMTLIVAIENANSTDIVKVGNEILTIDGSNIYAEINENFLYEDLLYGMILRSGNDAAMIIAKHSGGTVDNFIKLMNQKAKQLNLKNTTFQNPTGLDDTTFNTSTVEDLANMYSYGYKNKLFRQIMKTKEYRTSSDKKAYYFKNRNKLLTKYNKATGGKTGYTPKAGRLLVTSANNNDLNLVIASHGNEYGYDKHIKMYEDAFKKYKNYLILDKNSFKEKAYLKGKLYIKNSFIYPLTKEEKKEIKKKIVFNKKRKGYVGDIIVSIGSKEIHKEKIYLKKNKK